MKKNISVLIFFCFTAMAIGQNKFAEKITGSGNAMATSIMNKDYAALIQYTYPKIIELMGGEENLISTVSQGMRTMEEGGIKFSEIRIGTPGKIFKAGEELHCLVPQKITLTNHEGKVKASSYLLAISTNKGESWYFLDTAQLNEQNATEIFPDFNGNLKIPAKVAPEFVPN